MREGRMGHYADYMEIVDETFSSPDGRIKARLRKNSNLTLAFAPGAYRKYDDRSLERQLTSLVKELYEGRRRIHVDAMSAGLLLTAGRRAEVNGRPIDAKQRKFRDLRDQLETRGVSHNRSVRIFSTGMSDWQVRVINGTVGKTDEATFKQEVVTALGAINSDHQQQLASLKQKVYGRPNSRLDKRVTT